VLKRTKGLLIVAFLIESFPARAACWNVEDRSAALIRELQTHIFVGVLRCKISDPSIVEAYSRFLRANHDVISRASARLKEHFARSGAPAVGQRAYDSFTSNMANSFGSAANGVEACARIAKLADEGALSEGSREFLLLLADRESLAASLPGGLCGDATNSGKVIASPTRSNASPSDPPPNLGGSSPPPPSTPPPRR
jgi:hypothetical protein